MELLKQEYNLIVLQLSLDRSSSSPAGLSVFTLQAAGQTLTEIKVDSAELGLPNNLSEIRKYMYSDPPYTIPDRVVQALKQKLPGVLDAGIPLWLQFKDDYGNLAVIPWERLLQPQLAVPILRLPYFDLKPFSASSSSLDIVLCASSPEMKAAIPVEALLEKLIRRILDAKLRERVIIHVFTDSDIFHNLQHTLHDQITTGDGSGVQLYDPETSIDTATRYSGSTYDIPSLENPWLLWIVDALRGRSADVVHFLCHGYLGTDQGTLAFQSSPVPTPGYEPSCFVGPRQLTTFALRLGAWSVGFSSPVNNFSSSGLRLLADQLARLRTGPILLHETVVDPDDLALTQTYLFLCNEAQDALPSSPAIALYCHPNRIKKTAQPEDEINQTQMLNQYTLAKGETLKIMQSKENTPTWIASSQRYLEQSVADIMNANTNSSVSSATQEGTKEALSFLSDILERHASSGSSLKEGSQ